MAYALLVEQPGQTMEDFHAVSAALGNGCPIGRIALAAGPISDGIMVATIWRTKADADRFYAERLGPAFAQVLRDRAKTPRVTAVDLTVLKLDGGGAAQQPRSA